METALLLFLIILVNITLYWVFFGKKKFDQKMQGKMNEEVDDAGEISNH